MRHAKRPRFCGAPSVEDFEAFPELEVDFLPQVVTFGRVGFVAGGQAVERAAKVACSGLV